MGAARLGAFAYRVDPSAVAAESRAIAFPPGSPTWNWQATNLDLEPDMLRAFAVTAFLTGVGTSKTHLRPWAAVYSLAFCVATLIAAEFLPVSLLNPIASDLGVSEGQAGQAVSISAIFAVATSLLIATLSSRIDRRSVLIGLTALLALSIIIVASTGSYVQFMIGRAVLGIALGGFWALSTATVMNIVSHHDVPRALGIVFTGNAVASALAAPLGSWAGDIIGWRGVFWAVVPLALATLLFQIRVLPSMPPQRAASPAMVFALLARPHVRWGMLAVMMAFGGVFTAFTYFRPFLETYAGASVPQLSALLLILGLAGFAGTPLAGRLAGRHLYRLARILPLATSLIVALLLFAADSLWLVGLLMFVWGALMTASPVVWSTWLTRAVHDEPESAGGLFVAVIQTAILLGAALGGVLLDHVGISASFLGAVVLLLLAGSLAGRRIQVPTSPTK